VVIADSSKLGKRTFARICRTDEIADLVTDADADPDFLTGLREAGVNVLIATL
jgi:DeoR family transcriptional regulator, aga operon transcriptional repressor